MYFLSDDDLKTYYKKLTTYQRVYSRRLETFYSRTRSLKPLNSLEEIQKFLMADKPWYQVPDSLVTGDINWQSTITLTFHSELEGENDNELEEYISFFKREKDYFYVDRIRWDPNIPTEFQKYTVGLDVWQQYPLSQFSNCGFSPALDFYLREGYYPICKIIQRARFPPPVGDPEHKSHPVSRFRNTKGERRSEDVREYSFLTSSEPIPEPMDLDEMLKGLRRVDPDVMEAEAALMRQNLPTAEETEAGLQRAELLLQAMQGRLDTSTYLREAGLLDENQVDVFDNSDSDLGLDMF